MNFYYFLGKFSDKGKFKEVNAGTVPRQARTGHLYVLENLYIKVYLEIHKKTFKGAKKWNNMNIPMDPKELQGIRGNKNYS